MKRNRIVAAAITAAVALSALTACTAADKRIIDDFTSPKSGATPSASPTSKNIVDPSMDAYDKSNEQLPKSTTYRVKITGSVNQAVLVIDGKQQPLAVEKFQQTFESFSNQIVIVAQTKAKHGANAACSIYAEDGTVLESETTQGKSLLLTCTYARS